MTSPFILGNLPLVKASSTTIYFDCLIIGGRVKSAKSGVGCQTDLSGFVECLLVAAFAQELCLLEGCGDKLLAIGRNIICVAQPNQELYIASRAKQGRGD